MADDLKELFSTVGPVSRTWVNYDKTDRSEGTGGVVFIEQGSAEEAIKKYNGVPIAGQAIKLEYLARTTAAARQGMGRGSGLVFNNGGVRRDTSFIARGAPRRRA
eukprot:Filipodium_phascolosomae@DN142_c0_g1_i1.p1